MTGSQVRSVREKVTAGIVSPLGFFVLALSIVEAFLFGAGRGFDLPVETRTQLMWTGVSLFVGVVLIVTGLVIFCPKNLLFSEKSHFQLAMMFGNKEHPTEEPVITAAVGPPPNVIETQARQLEGAQAEEGGNRG